MTNRYGVDVAYFKKELAALSRSLPDRTPDELARYFMTLHNIALPIPKLKESRPTVRAKRPAQQLKPKMPSELKMLTDLGWEKLDRNSNQVAHVAHVIYMYLARHFGH
jgi:hypothetical protein